jgi:hypothetical protein
MDKEYSGRNPVRYIGKRPEYRDGAYDTGIVWTRGETKMVPEHKAKLMLRHADQYEPGDIDGAGEPDIVEPDIDEDTQEDEDLIRDSIIRMDRKAKLMEFAKTNFNMHLNPNKKIVDLQRECIRLVDQFGMPQ